MWWKFKNWLHFKIPNWLPICRGCEGPCFRIVFRKYRQNTSYVDEKQNWVKLCGKCKEINEEYWAEMWSDYYRAEIWSDYYSGLL